MHKQLLESDVLHVLRSPPACLTGGIIFNLQAGCFQPTDFWQVTYSYNFDQEGDNILSILITLS